MAELVDAADSKSVFERSGSSSLPRGTKIKKGLAYARPFFSSAIKCFPPPLPPFTLAAAMLRAALLTRKLVRFPAIQFQTLQPLPAIYLSPQDLSSTEMGIAPT